MSNRNIIGLQLNNGQQLIGELLDQSNSVYRLSHACYLRFEPVRDESGQVIQDANGRPKAMGSVFVKMDLGYMKFENEIVELNKSYVLFPFTLREDILAQYEDENYMVASVGHPSIKSKGKLILG